MVVSDVVMPHLGGVGLVHDLRNEGYTGPVLFMSGYASKNQLPPLGDDLDILEKPFPAAALVARVRVALARREPPMIT